MNRKILSLSLLMLVASMFFSCENGKKKSSAVFSTSHDEAVEQVEEEEETYDETENLDKVEYNDIKEEAKLEEGLSRIPYEQLEQPAPMNSHSEMLLFKNQFIISFNTSTNCPNYVAWRLTKERTRGNAQRTDEFTVDYVLNEAARVETYDYNGSGYDRGHMCPAADNKNDIEAMKQSFMMTNVCPQNHDLNAGTWNELEQLCRQWAKDYGDVYIACGPIYDKRPYKTIGKRKDIKVAVPDRFFKVVLMEGRTTRAIGFIFPNAPVNDDIRNYCMSVDKVEKATGLDFYPELDDKVEKKVEAECNPGAWGL